MKPYHLVFRVRRKYFNDIVDGVKKIEYRKASPFWKTRVQNLSVVYATTEIDMPLVPFAIHVENVIGIFICGKDVHRRTVPQIDYIYTPRWFSEIGKKDVDTDTCFAFHLADVVNRQQTLQGVSS